MRMLVGRLGWEKKSGGLSGRMRFIGRTQPVRTPVVSAGRKAYFCWCALFKIGHFCSGSLWSSLFFFDVYPVRFTIGNSVDDRLGGSRYYCGVNRGRYGRDSLAGSICWGGIWQGCLVSDHEHFWWGTVHICHHTCLDRFSYESPA